MDELISAQKSTWEEKETLSKQLEEERQNNVNVAIGQVMSHGIFQELQCKALRGVCRWCAIESPLKSWLFVF